MAAPSERIPRFEIHWVHLPHQRGHAQIGTRPAVVLIDEPGHGFLIVLPITTNLARSRFPCTLQLQPSPENGLPRTSLVLGFQIRDLGRGLVKDRIGVLSQEEGKILDALLAGLLGLESPRGDVERRTT